MAYTCDTHDFDIAVRAPRPAALRVLKRIGAALRVASQRLAAWSDQDVEDAITRRLLARSGGRLTDGLEREAQRIWMSSPFYR